MKQLLRNMAREVRLVALQRLPEEIYVNHFEAEFGARHLAAAAPAPVAAEEAALSDVASSVAGDGFDAAVLEQDLGEVIEAMVGAPESPEDSGRPALDRACFTVSVCTLCVIASDG